MVSKSKVFLNSILSSPPQYNEQGTWIYLMKYKTLVVAMSSKVLLFSIQPFLRK